MDEIPAQRPERRSYIRRQYTRQAHTDFRFNPMTSRLSCRRNAQAQKVPPALRAQAAELRSARANLDRACAQVQNVGKLSARCVGVAARARAERRYVNCLIRYLRDTNQMTPVQASEMQANFTRRKMEASGLNNTVYLLSMYPQELK